MNSKAALARPELNTEHLLLRHPDEEDIGAITKIVGDWEVARHLARVPHPYGPADATFFLEHVVPSEWVWAITIMGSVELVGAVGLTPTKSTTEAELGYWLSRFHWGKGIMTEAATAVISYGFDALDLSRVTSSYFDGNPASGRVLEKLGFIATGRAMQHCLAARSDMPSVKMCLSRPDAPDR